VQFRHRLEGFDADWRTAARTRRASYPGLPPGRYTFRVAAADQAGNWREAPENLVVTVQPFFWETLWFQAGGVLLLVAASGAGTWRHLHRKHRRQLAELERERKVQADLAEAKRVALQLAADLRVAREIQMGMIPHDFSRLEKEFGVQLAGALDPAREVGGDLYCAFAAESGRLVLIMGDVSGKGIPASLFMVRASTLARLLAGQIREPERILAALNDQLSAENPSMMFCTLVCAVFDKTTHCLEIVNGGHTLPVLLRKSQPPTWAVPALNPALGFLPGTRFERKELLLTEGDTVVLYTDGVSEAFNQQRERYGNERLLKNLTASNGAAASGIVARLLEDVRTFSDGAPQSDDIAVLVLRLAEPTLAGINA
jgi:sigma-B regulation protein RsbU (phosphoserine phosphatase)